MIYFVASSVQLQGLEDGLSVDSKHQGSVLHIGKLPFMQLVRISLVPSLHMSRLARIPFREIVTLYSRSRHVPASQILVAGRADGRTGGVALASATTEWDIACGM